MTASRKAAQQAANIDWMRATIDRNGAPAAKSGAVATPVAEAHGFPITDAQRRSWSIRYHMALNPEMTREQAELLVDRNQARKAIR